MKKYIFLISFIIGMSLYTIPSYARTVKDDYSSVCIVQVPLEDNYTHNMYYKGHYYVIGGYPWSSSTININSSNMTFAGDVYNIVPVSDNYIFWGFPTAADAMLFINSGFWMDQESGIQWDFTGSRTTISSGTKFNCIINIQGNEFASGDGIYDSYEDWFQDQIPEGDDDQTKSWFKNLWDFIMDTLAITDDFSNDLYDWIFEGDDGDGGHSSGHSFEYITPTPSPTPTPAPTPTPYTLDIVDNNGNPVYTITGIPNQTITINNTTNNENGDDFDIFEVDVKLLPSGGVSNPKDGLNSVMESNLEVLEDIDVTPVGASFSVLPSDWFIMLGAIICMPFIAGFISKLLK